MGFRRTAWALLALVPTGVGCRFTDNAWHTIIVEPAQYPAYWEHKRSLARFRATANEALEQERATAKAECDDYVHEPFSPAYERGFVDGFVDYLEAGGDGNPPPLPPRKLWNVDYQSPDGYIVAREWFNGFRHGAAVARNSGLRELVIVPLSDAVAGPPTPYPVGPDSSVALPRPKRLPSVATETSQGWWR